MHVTLTQIPACRMQKKMNALFELAESNQYERNECLSSKETKKIAEYKV